jgi:hypothetical protein
MDEGGLSDRLGTGEDESHAGIVSEDLDRAWCGGVAMVRSVVDA